MATLKNKKFKHLKWRIPYKTSNERRQGLIHETSYDEKRIGYNYVITNRIPNTIDISKDKYFLEIISLPSLDRKYITCKSESEAKEKAQLHFQDIILEKYFM